VYLSKLLGSSSWQLCLRIAVKNYIVSIAKLIYYINTTTCFHLKQKKLKDSLPFLGGFSAQHTLFLYSFTYF